MISFECNGVDVNYSDEKKLAHFLTDMTSNCCYRHDSCDMYLSFCVAHGRESPRLDTNICMLLRHCRLVVIGFLSFAIVSILQDILLSSKVNPLPGASS